MADAVLIPAATVVLLRDGPTGPETLMMRRNSTLDFAGGMWVFPGGRIDPEDFDEPVATIDADVVDPDVMLRAARRAAVREAREESGLEVEGEPLVWFSHWTPPTISPKRFATWFFAARAPEGAVTIDGGEIHDHAWMTPLEAQRRRDDHDIELAPPTWITLSQLAAFESVDEALRGLAANTPTYFATRFAPIEGGAVLLYDGDAGYETSEPDLPGRRHRLWMVESGWRYEQARQLDSPTGSTGVTESGDNT